MIQPVRSFASDAGRRGILSLQLVGRRLVAVRLIWVMLVLLTACVFAANLVLMLGHLQVLCAGTACQPGQLSPGVARR